MESVTFCSAGPRLDRTFCSKCQILDGTEYSGGSWENWHFAIYVRNPDWKPEFTGTFFLRLFQWQLKHWEVQMLVFFEFVPQKMPVCCFFMTELGATHVCCHRGYHRPWIDSVAAFAVSDGHLFGIKKRPARTPLRHCKTSCANGEYTCFFFKGGIKTVEK